ncbi:MAG TPA: DnaT-like ssDNA-binding protein [Humisphaera sp.]
MPIEAIPLGLSASAYLDVAGGDDLAAALPDLTAYRSADAGEKAAALLQASDDVDAAMPYQGRRFDPRQPREFPRWVDAGAAGGIASAGPETVWAWDAGAAVAVVPADVRRATLYQADSILAGTREARLSAQHDGVVYELTGGLAESYKATPGPGVPTGLCRRAWAILRRYRTRGGRLA